MQPSMLAVLTSAEGRAAVDSAASDLESGMDSLSLISRLRASFDAEVAREILAQAQLRKKAIAKLGPRAARLVLLGESLEQASRAEVAGSRARRLVAAGVTGLTDAGAGLGADSLAYAAAGLRVRAIERDPDVAAVLRANTGAVSAPADAATDAASGAVGETGSGSTEVTVSGLIEVLEGDALDLMPESGVVYFDPARRADGRRIFDPELCSPPLSELIAAHEHGLTVVAKMSPSLKVGDVPAGWDADWVSTQTEQGRSVVEAVLWSPPLGTGVRRAIVLNHKSEHSLDSRGTKDDVSLSPIDAAQHSPDPQRGAVPAAMTVDTAEIEVGDIGRFIYEPDGAVNQAELTGELAALLDARIVEPRIAYLTGDTAIDSPFAHRYEVLDSLPWSKRGLARALGQHDASDLVIKKRGITVDPTALRKELLPRLRSRTGEPLVVILTPHRGQQLALLTRAG